MDLTNVSIVALVTVTLTDVLKEFWPNISGNLTRAVAVVIGLILGYLGQINVIPAPGLNVITGVAGGLTAIAGHTIAQKMGGE